MPKINDKIIKGIWFGSVIIIGPISIGGPIFIGRPIPIIGPIIPIIIVIISKAAMMIPEISIPIPFPTFPTYI